MQSMIITKQGSPPLANLDASRPVAEQMMERMGGQS